MNTGKDSMNLACPCCGKDKTVPELRDLAYALKDAFTAGYPDLMFQITSGYRCPPHNEAVGGKSHSAHLTGRAIDVWAPTSAYRYAVVETVMALARAMDYTIRMGLRTGHVHIDIGRKSFPAIPVMFLEGKAKKR